MLNVCIIFFDHVLKMTNFIDRVYKNVNPPFEKMLNKYLKMLTKHFKNIKCV